MKKLIFALFVIVALFTCAAHAEEARLPDFDVRLNGTLVESECREFPLLEYKGITYFPMTYYDSRFLGLVSNWDNDTRTLSITKQKIGGMYRDYAALTKNAKTQTAEVCGFNIVINGKVYDNASEEYPMLTFRGVTYFPLTWRLTHDEFGWEYSFTNDGLMIDADNYHTEILDLPGYDGKGLIIDEKCCYYQGADGDVYRAPIDEPSKAEKIIDVLADDRYVQGKPMVIFDFDKDNRSLYAYYHLGGASMGTDHAYLLAPEGEVEEIDYWKTNGNTRMRFQSGITEYHFYDSVVSMNSRSDSISYTYKGADGSVTMPGMEFGSADALDTKLYFIGTIDDKTDIYRIDMTDNSIDKVVENVDKDTVIYSYPYDNVGSYYPHLLLFSRGGNLYRWFDGEDRRGKYIREEKLIMENFTLIDASACFDCIWIIGSDGSKTMAVNVNNFGLGSQYISFKTRSPIWYSISYDCICVMTKEELPDEDIRFVVLDDRWADYKYKSSDLCQNVTTYRDKILVYTVDGKAVKVDLKQ